jgi:hypothetical protein
MILKFVTGAASSAVPVRTLLDWNVDDPLPDVARRNPAAARVSGASRRGPRVREWRECPSPQVLNRARRVGVSLLQRCAVRIRGSSTAQSGRVRGSLAMTCDDGAYAAVIRQAVGPGPSLGARHERDHRRQRALPSQDQYMGGPAGVAQPSRPVDRIRISRRSRRWQCAEPTPAAPTRIRVLPREGAAEHEAGAVTRVRTRCTDPRGAEG